jgi:molybdopterin molybdotransferase
VIAFDEAVAIVSGLASPVGRERVGIARAHGRVLAAPAVARVDSPPADVSAMDGYAVRDEDLRALPASLRVIGEAFAGAGFGGTVEPGTSARIFTGAPLPAGADRIVIQEVVRREGDFAVIDSHPGAAKHVRRCGNDFGAGTTLVGAGRKLGFREIVAVAGGDLAEVDAWRRPTVRIFGTGDELAPPGTASQTAGSIPESVSHGVAALAEDWGASVVERLHLRDDLELMKGAAAGAVGQADLIVITGGASVGDKDFAKAMFADQGLEFYFTKVAIKPGKPVWLGRAGTSLIMGLPGNPTSALVTARLLLAPLVAGLSGLDPGSALSWREAPLAEPLSACGDRETFVRARAAGGAIEPVSNQDSSAQKTLADADLLVRRLAAAPAAAAGDMVPVLDF